MQCPALVRNFNTDKISCRLRERDFIPPGVFIAHCFNFVEKFRLEGGLYQRTAGRHQVRPGTLWIDLRNVRVLEISVLIIDKHCFN